MPRETKVAIIGRPNVGKSTLLNALTGTSRAIVSPVAGTTRDAVDELMERDGHTYRFIDTAGIRRKGKTELMAEKLSVVMARKHLEAADVALIIIDAVEGVTAGDATIAGYAHESGRSVVVVINKWDLVTRSAPTASRPPIAKSMKSRCGGTLKFLSYAPVVFVSASTGKNLDKLFSTLELVARERRKRVGTGEMNRFLNHVDFERASVPMSKRVKILLHDAGESVAADVHPVHRSRGEAALLLSALPGKSDPCRLRLRRHAHLDQEPRTRGREVVITAVGTSFLIERPPHVLPSFRLHHRLEPLRLPLPQDRASPAGR